MFKQEPRGKRSNYIKVGITMSPEMYRAIKFYGLHLSEKGYRDTDLSSVIRRAVNKLLSEGDMQ